MRSKLLLASLIYSLIGVLIMFQSHLVLAFDSTSPNPITAAITSVITSVTNSLPTPQPSPATQPVTSPVIVSPSPTPTPTQAPAPISSSITDDRGATSQTALVGLKVTQLPTIDTVSPNPAAWGAEITLTGTNLTNASEIYLNDSLIPSIFYKNASNDNTKISFTMPAFINFKANQTYQIYIKNQDQKSNQLNLTVNPSSVHPTATPSAHQVLVAPDVAIDQIHTDLLVEHSNFDINVFVPNKVASTVNLSDLLIRSNSENHAVLNTTLTLNSQTSLGSIKVQIPTLTQIQGPPTWNGAFNTPAVLENTQDIKPTADNGFTALVQSALEIGVPDTGITFDKAVRIQIPNQAGKLIGFQTGVNFTKIDQNCAGDTQEQADKLAAGGNCYINVGNDLVVWTKHFTKFVIYTQSASNQSQTSSVSTDNSQAAVCADLKPQTAPKLLKAYPSGRNEVTLTWSKAADPLTYYLVAYGSKEGSLEYGNPNVGSRDTVNYVVKGLQNGQTYYFRVRAGNNCMPGEFSNEMAVTVLGNNIPNPVARGFKASILVSKKSQALPFQPITSASSTHIKSGATNFLVLLWNLLTKFVLH